MGSTVVRGEVEGTVEFTGANTFFGRTASLLQVLLRLPTSVSSAPPRSLPHPVRFSFLRDRRQNDSEPSNLQNMLMDIMIVLVRHHRSFCHRIRPPSSIPPSSPDHCLPRRAPSPARWWYL